MMANRVLKAKMVKLLKARAERRRQRPRFVWDPPPEYPNCVKICNEPLVYLHWSGQDYHLTCKDGDIFKTSIIYVSSNYAKWAWKNKYVIWESEIDMLLTCAGCGKILGQTKPLRSNSSSYTLCHKCKEDLEAKKRLAALKIDQQHEETECSNTSTRTMSYKIGF